MQDILSKPIETDKTDIDITFNDTIFLNLNESVTCDRTNKSTSQKQNKLSNQSTVNNVSSSSDIINTQERCYLSSWGLPENILQKYESRGLCKMFEWQAECLNNNNVLQKHSNLVYSAPTSAGKTLVAEILAIKTVLERQKKVIIILPFVSVVREKMFYLQDIFNTSGIRVDGFMGSHNPPGGFRAVQVAICTIEKANGLINRSLEENNLDEIGAVIIDEMHLLGDSSRGYLLELLLTKLRYMSIKNENVKIQLIGMSATLPNLDILAKWLDAELYTTEFRPIPLNEYYLIDNEIFNKHLKVERKLKSLPELSEDTDHVLQLCLETINESCSILIFCPTKNWCENLSQQISTAIYKLGHSNSPFAKSLRQQLNGRLISEVLVQLRNCPVGLDVILKKTVSFGVAFHHAGLTIDERDIIESAFRSGALRILIATSTLSSGVNLPAKRVVIRTPMFHGRVIDTLTYRQMTGRAGRMGQDTSGESIVVSQKNQKTLTENLLTADLPYVESCLEGSGRVKRAILEVIASGVACTPSDLKLFTDCTLLAVEENDYNERSTIEKTVEFLCRNEFVRLQNDENGELRYVATNLAKACLTSSVSPEDGLVLFEELEKARKCIALDTDLHLLYLVTPYSVCNQWNNIDWMLFLSLWEKLSLSNKRVAELVGVNEGYVFNATRGKINMKLYQKYQIHQRFFTALALQDLVNEVPLHVVATKFKCSRGLLQSLQQSASTFAGMVTIFCRQLGWKSLQILVSQFQDRLQFGVHHELIDLMKLSLLNGPRARILFNSGIETLADLANADVCRLENILYASVPFQSEKEREGETSFDVEQKKKMRCIFITGKEGLTPRNAAEILIRDAQKYLQLEMGAADVKWEDNKNDATVLDDKSVKNTSVIQKNDLNCDSNNLIEKIKTQNTSEIIGVKSVDDLNINFNNSLIEENQIQNISSSIKPLTSNYAETCNSNESVVLDKTNDFNSDFNDSLFTNIQTQNSENSIKILHEKSKRDDLVQMGDLTTGLNDSLFSEIQTQNSQTSTETSNEKAAEVLLLYKMTDSEKTSNSNCNGISEDGSVILMNDLNSAFNDSSFSKIQTQNSPSYSDSIKDLNNLLDKSRKSSTFDYDIKEHMKNDLIDFNNSPNKIQMQNSLNHTENTILDNCLQLNSTKNDSANLEWSKFAENFIEDKNSPLNNSNKSLFSDSIDFKLCDITNSNNQNGNVRNNSLNLSGYSNWDENINFTDVLNNASELSFTAVEKKNNSDIIDTSSPEVNKSLKKRNKSKSVSKKRKKIKNENDHDFCETPKKKTKVSSKNDMNTTFSVCSAKKDDVNILDLRSIEIIDVCGNKTLFETFRSELVTQKHISLSVACEHVQINKPCIGQKIIKSNNNKVINTQDMIFDDKKITGIAICWENNSVYYISFENEQFIENSQKVILLKHVLENSKNVVRIFDAKEQCKLLMQGCKFKINCSLEDPKIADWILEPEEREKNLQALALKYCPEIVGISQLGGQSKGTKSIAMTVESIILSHVRASVEAIVSWHVLKSQIEMLYVQNPNLLNTFSIEMRSIACLISMELTGLGVDTTKINFVVDSLKEHIKCLEQKAYSLAGRHFAMLSSKDVAKVLGMYNGKKVSTNKQVLEKSIHPVAKLILQWRKLTSTLTKMMLPLIRLIRNNRIHGFCLTHTSTGRISMQEPNLQNVPRNFEIVKPDSNVTNMSIRASFVASKENIFISADYCQLELRIISHLSQDSVLIKIMKSNEDVFKSIAAKLNNINENEVTDILRQRAKQLCYGIIYGMGPKVLSQQLNSSENEALEFMESFKNNYPSIRTYIQRTIERCKVNGFVETLGGRRRYLPHINHENLALKNQAERQAVNTTVQGSAADIAKTAMVHINDNLRKCMLSEKASLVLHLHDELMYEVQSCDFKEVAKLIKCSMETAIELTVPLPVKLKFGPSWGDLNHFDL